MNARHENRGEDWARALGAVPSGLFVITTGRGDEATGFLGSFVQQVGFEPPCLAIAVQSGRPIEALIRATDGFCVSVLDEQSRYLMAHFARGFGPGEPAFEGLDIERTPSGLVFSPDALAWIECRLRGEATWSDHTVFCGEVIAGFRRPDSLPLVHVRKTGTSY